jgi:4-diphosphocytidyl-2-C-methyl-D-erythritol kinase
MGLPRLFALLVNPRVPVETPAVFRELGLKPGEAMGGSAHPALASVKNFAGLLQGLKGARNDLQPPACRLQPVIAEALNRVSATEGCALARMSGSGATVFGLYEDCGAAAAAARAIRRARPDWWARGTILR